MRVLRFRELRSERDERDPNKPLFEIRQRHPEPAPFHHRHMQCAHDDRAAHGPQRNLPQHRQEAPPARAVRGCREPKTDGERAHILRQHDEHLQGRPGCRKRERHQRDAVVAGVVKHRRQLQAAHLRRGITAQAAGQHAEHEHRGDDAKSESHHARRDSRRERGADDLHENERGHEQADVQFHQGSEVEPEPAVEHPSEAHEHEDRHADLGEYIPEQHGAVVAAFRRGERNCALALRALRCIFHPCSAKTVSTTQSKTRG